MADTFVCNLDRLTPEQRERHEHVAAGWMDHIRERERVDDGCAFTLPADPGGCRQRRRVRHVRTDLLARYFRLLPGRSNGTPAR
ncbi:MAG: hypothetical protein U5Q44_12890 [Dehalococcoidia bacterium]|nr:hypothetical protein [Dehalococcoidia bacterium]